MSLYTKIIEINSTGYFRQYKEKYSFVLLDIQSGRPRFDSGLCYWYSSLT